MRIPIYSAALAAALAFAVPVQAEVVEQEADAFVTKDSVTVKATARETWLKLISPGEWWNSSHTFSGDAANMMLTPQAGGCFCERIPANDSASKIGLAGSVEHMTVLLSIPDTALRMRGSLGPLQSEPVTGILTVTMAESDEGTTVTFEYAVGGYMRFDVPVIAKAVDAVVSQQLSGLSKQLEPITSIEGSTEEGPDEAAPKAEPEEPASASDTDVTGEDAEAKEKEDKVSVEDAFGDFDLGDQ